MFERPGSCEKCGSETNKGNPVDRFQGKWVCEQCLNKIEEPLEVEMFVYSNSNLGEAV